MHMKLGGIGTHQGIKKLLFRYFTPEGNYNNTISLVERVVLRILLSSSSSSREIKRITLSKPSKLIVTVPARKCIFALLSPLLGVRVLSRILPPLPSQSK
jgi:hypothetical protein